MLINAIKIANNETILFFAFGTTETVYQRLTVVVDKRRTLRAFSMFKQCIFARASCR